jgi:hypothetical protein
MVLRRGIATAAAAPALGLLACTTWAAAAPKAELWPRWQRSDPGSTLVVDHGAWTEFLAAYLVAGGDGINRLTYGRVTPQDRRALAAYLARLAGTPVGTLRRGEQRAFWINLYNALTVDTVLGHYPVKSIRDIDISPGLFSIGPWGRKLIEIEGEALSLDDIEHRILRPIWRDPRTHYAVNCASLSCPNLAASPYAAADMEAMLEAGARAYVNHPRGARVGPDGRLVVSSIYRWYGADFGGSDAAIITHLRRYAVGDQAARLARATRIDGDEYNWTLNDATPR